MKVIYLECDMGAAGDMIMAALLELYDRPQEFIERMNHLGIPGVKLEHLSLDGISGSFVQVQVDGEEEICSDADVRPDKDEICWPPVHHHTGLHEIQTLISRLRVSEKVKQSATAVYEQIARAEAKAHCCPVGEVHFHEVGSRDAVADIVGCCLLLELLAPEAVLASPVNVGSGFVKCAHGILPVPAPATAILLEGAPYYQSETRGELCTPTGAALLRHFAADFVPMPPIQVEKVGVGMGQKHYPKVNGLRAYLGEFLR